MSDFLTRVHLHYGYDQFNSYTRFGNPKYRDKVGPRESYEFYSQRSVFGYVRWCAGEYGTDRWQFYVLAGGTAETPLGVITGIAPGAEVLAEVSGKTAVHRLFAAVDRIEADAIDPCDVAPWYWVQTHARIHAALEPLAYSVQQHAAWLREKDVSP